jgi:heme exporter protein C
VSGVVFRPATRTRRLSRLSKKFRAWPDLLEPRVAFSLSGMALPWVASGAVTLIALGFLLSIGQGLHGVSQLGMLHLPAVWLATLLMLVIVFWSAVGLLLGRSLPLLLAQALVPTAGMFTFLALWSGALWARAVHGVWWQPDARQLAEVALFAAYIAMVSIPSLLVDPERADRAVALVAMGCCTLIPMLFFALDWWTLATQHSASLPLQLDPQLLPAMLLVAGGLWFYATYVGLVRLRCLVKERELGLVGVFSPK